MIGRGSKQWEISFICCGLGAKELKTLKNQIALPEKTRRIQALFIITVSDNPLDTTAIEQLLEMRQALKNLQTLSLRYTQLNDEIIDLFLTFLQSVNFSLNLAENDISDEGIGLYPQCY